MLINFDQQIDKLQQIRSGKIIEGLALGFPEIDEYFRFKQGNFLVCLGHANVGKTTVILYMMLLYSLKHNTRWLVFSSENEAHSIIRKLIEFLAAKPINKIPEEEFEKHKSFVFNQFKIIDSNELHTYKTLLELATSIKKAWNYHGFLIDPYNSLMKDREMLKGINSHDYDYEATSEIRLFCKTHNVSVWLNTHAATESLRKKHSNSDEYAGHPIPPMASDVEGGGKFVNRSDEFLVIHRYTQHPTDWMYNHIHVRKVKDIDTGGRPTPLTEPIKLKSILNNVGFQINGSNIITPTLTEQINLPF